MSENYDAFVDWKRSFVNEKGASAKDDFKEWLRTLDPIASRLNDADEREFEQTFLTREQKGRLSVARHYAHELRDTLVVWWDADQRSNEMRKAVLFSAFNRMDVSSPDDRQQESVARDIRAMASSPAEAYQLMVDHYVQRYGKPPTDKRGRTLPGFQARVNRLKEIYGIAP